MVIRSADNCGDLIDWMMAAAGLREQCIQALLGSPRFVAAASAYAGSRVPLVYAAWFCQSNAQELGKLRKPDQIVDALRITHRRNLLPKSDPRYISLYRDRAEVLFPELFASQGLARFDLLKEVPNDFIVDHPRRDSLAGTVRSEEDLEYVTHWVDTHWNQVAELLTDRKFRAGLDAFCQGLLSYGGFSENIFGDADHILFPTLGWNYSALALGVIAHQLERRGVVLDDSRNDYPEIYEFYDPEAFGPRS